MDPDVPILLPLANPDHVQILKNQQDNRGWRGAIITNSNCTTTPVVMSLAPLLKHGIEKIHLVSAQAISGAGHPGVASLDILDNIIPFIANEEEKLSQEPLKMLGDLFEGNILPLQALCKRHLYASASARWSSSQHRCKNKKLHLSR